MVFSGNLWSCLKELKPLVMFDRECKMPLEPMQGNRSSSRVDLGYSELFLYCCGNLREPVDL